ncbi:MAG: hypothetical protein ABR978_07200 [Dehalococcoidia bacterium]
MPPTDEGPLAEGHAAIAASAAQLFDLHFDQLYDFCFRLLGEPAAAAQASEEAFRNALASSGGAAQMLSFKAQLFSAALDAVESRFTAGQPIAPAQDPLFYRVDAARLPSTVAAPLAEETAGVIYETLSRLDPSDYVLLDLALRQGLDERELSAVLKRNTRALHSRLDKLEKEMSRDLSALLVARRGSRNCDGMRRAVLELPVSATRDQVRRVTDRHIRSCPVCFATRAAIPSPLAVFAALALMPPPADVREAARQRIIGAAPSLLTAPIAAVIPEAPAPAAAGALAGGGGVIPPPPGLFAALGDAWRRFISGARPSNNMVLPVIGALVVLIVAVGIAWATGVFGGSGGGGGPTPTRTSTSTRTATATASPSPQPSETAVPTATPTEEAPTATPPPPTAVPSATPLLATATRTPRATRSPTVAATEATTSTPAVSTPTP